MSDKPAAVIKKEEPVEEEEVEEVTTTTKKGLLGFNFNDPIVLAATVLGVGIIGAIGWSFIRNFIFQKPVAPAPQQPVNVTVTPEQLRQAQYERDLETASRNMFATNMNTIEANTKELKNDGVHYYDQFFNQYQRKPATTTTFEDDIEIVDDNNDPIVTVNQKQTYYKPAPPTVQVNKPNFNVKPPPQRQEIKSQEVIDDDDITMITSDEPDLNKIPPEFVNVGNQETTFDKIEPSQQQPQRKQQQPPQQQDISFENLEMDEKVLEQMAAGSYIDNY